MNLAQIFKMGSSHTFLRLCDCYGVQVKSETGIIVALDRLASGLEELNVCETEILQFREYISELEEKYKEGQKLDNNDQKRISKHFDNTMRKITSEIEEIEIFDNNTKTGLDRNELRKLSKQETCIFFPDDLWSKFSDIEKNDYSDAAKCLLFNAPTPAVMIALRGCEASIRQYYTHCTKLDAGKFTWRQIIKELQNNASALNLEASFLEYLDYYGDAKRNFAQHPNKVYSSREAVLIFMQIMGLIDDIYKQMN